MGMDRAIERVRRGFECEGGFTLVEMIVAVAILGIALTVFTTMLVTVQKATVNEDVRSRSLDQARLALQSIDRESRSGNLLYDPSNLPAGYPPATYPPGYTLLIYTQSNTPTFGTYRCVLWQIDSSENLVTKWWPADDPANPVPATGWATVATGVVNRDVSPAVTAFTLDTTNSRTITATLLVNSDLAHNPSATLRLQTSITGRDTSFGYPLTVCATPPT
jgi:prepilin-type N-terminal cleavage/methylation domain-containing protein